MAISNYYSLLGEILGERSVSGSSLDYLSDALASVAIASDGTTDHAATYTPYGTGSAPNGATFGWVGTLGYRMHTLSDTYYYVRARHYSPARGVWVSADPHWPAERVYCYCDSNPVSNADPSGLRQEIPCCCCPDKISADDGKISSTIWRGMTLPCCGNKFTVHWGISYHQPTKDELPAFDCQMVWMEQSTGSDPNDNWTWVDQYPGRKGKTNMFDDWDNTGPNTSCSNSPTGDVADEPCLFFRADRPNVTRTLQLSVTIKKPAKSNCKCKFSECTVTATQYLTEQNGKCVKNILIPSKGTCK